MFIKFITQIIKPQTDFDSKNLKFSAMFRISHQHGINKTCKFIY